MVQFEKKIMKVGALLGLSIPTKVSREAGLILGKTYLITIQEKGKEDLKGELPVFEEAKEEGSCNDKIPGV